MLLKPTRHTFTLENEFLIGAAEVVKTSGNFGPQSNALEICVGR